MPRITRLIFVLPLVLATCGVAVLNGNVLCIAGAEHVAVEPEHGPGDCPEGGHHEADGDAGHCTDVSADFHLLRAGDRSTVDHTYVELPHFLAAETVGAVAWCLVDRALCRTDESPPLPRAAALRSVVMLN